MTVKQVASRAERERLLHRQWVRTIESRARTATTKYIEYPLICDYVAQVKIRDAVRGRGFRAEIVKHGGFAALEVETLEAQKIRLV